jgi:hypothetical protein
VLEGEAADALEAMPEYSSEAGAEVGRAAVRVASFAFSESVGGRDWSGRGFAESAALAQGLALEPDRGRDCDEAGPRLAGRFWRALVRGGLQAALYVLDTEAAAVKAATASSGSSAATTVAATTVAKGARR